VFPAEYAVRSPLEYADWAPDLMVSHPKKGWVSLIICEFDIDDFSTDKLFTRHQANPFESYLARHERLMTKIKKLSAQTFNINTLIVFWKCSDAEVTALTDHHEHNHFTFISRNQFLQDTFELMEQYFIFQNTDTQQALQSVLFPESKIPKACTPRRDYHRNNAEVLNHYFLDYEQEQITKLDLILPEKQAETVKDYAVRIVNGVAGSGKTLIVINRALMLCRLFPKKRILLLIHNRGITSEIKYKITKYWNGIPNNLDVMTFYSWCRKQWLQVMGKTKLFIEFRDQPIIDKIQASRMNMAGLKISDAQLFAELSYIDNYLIKDLDAYLEVVRTGRGFALQNSERRIVWAIYESLSPQLSYPNTVFAPKMARDIYYRPEVSEIKQDLLKYDYIIADEAQFFAPSWFELVKDSLMESGQLFLCADPNQGFLKSRLSWKSVGLEVRGRTRKLRRSYRTTYEILQAANIYLRTHAKEDPEDYLTPEYDNMPHGARPALIYSDTNTDMLDQLISEIERIVVERIVPIEDILILYTGRIYRTTLLKRLKAVVGEKSIWCYKQSNTPPNGYEKDYLRVSRLEAATGLEAATVFILGIDAITTAHLNMSLNEDEKKETQTESAKKLYMAMTRASQKLIMLSTEKVPNELEKVVDVIERFVPDRAPL